MLPVSYHSLLVVHVVFSLNHLSQLVHSQHLLYRDIHRQHACDEGSREDLTDLERRHGRGGRGEIVSVCVCVCVSVCIHQQISDLDALERVPSSDTYSIHKRWLATLE